MIVPKGGIILFLISLISLVGDGRSEKAGVREKRLEARLELYSGLPEMQELVPPGCLTCCSQCEARARSNCIQSYNLLMSVWQTSKASKLKRRVQRGLCLHYVSYWNCLNEGQRPLGP